MMALWLCREHLWEVQAEECRLRCSDVCSWPWNGGKSGVCVESATSEALPFLCTGVNPAAPASQGFGWLVLCVKCSPPTTVSYCVAQVLPGRDILVVCSDSFASCITKSAFDSTPFCSLPCKMKSHWTWASLGRLGVPLESPQRGSDAAFACWHPHTEAM